MTFSLQHTHSELHLPMKGTEVSVIRREFFTLTGDLFSAVILNQLMYWTLRVKDFDLLLAEERRFQPDCNISPRHGWIYKTADELNDETMLGISAPTIRKYLRLLIERGWIEERSHPIEKWNKTAQYRVNLRKLKEDLLVIGRTLPDVYLKAFRSVEGNEEPSYQKNFASKERNFASKENSNEYPPETQETSNQKIFASEEKILASNQRNFASNQKIFASNTENTTKNKTENTNREHTHRAGAEGEQDSTLEAGERPSGVCAFFEPSSLKKEKVPVAEAMVQLWKQHVGQELLTPTKKRSHLLEAALKLRFGGDINQWEALCERIKAAPFLMGRGASGWHISLDWVLREENLLKVLEGNFDSPEAQTEKQQEASWQDHDLKVQATLDTIKDPTWKRWCTELAFPQAVTQGRPPERLSLWELEAIAPARFLEFDGRIVFIETEDPRCASRIEDLWFKIHSVSQRDYPASRAVRASLKAPTVPVSGGLAPLNAVLSQHFNTPTTIGETHV